MVGEKVEYKMLDTQRGLKAIKVRLTSNNIDAKCIEPKGQDKVKLHGLDCIKMMEDGQGCVTLQDFKLSLHLFESLIDGEIEFSEICEHITCRCETIDIIH